MEQCREGLPIWDTGSSGGERKGLCGIEARRQEHARKQKQVGAVGCSARALMGQ